MSLEEFESMQRLAAEMLVLQVRQTLETEAFQLLREVMAELNTRTPSRSLGMAP